MVLKTELYMIFGNVFIVGLKKGTGTIIALRTLNVN